MIHGPLIHLAVIALKNFQPKSSLKSACESDLL